MFVEWKEKGEVTEAPAKITKLSQALRIGAKIRPQCHTVAFHDGKSCAIGAAYEAVFGHPGNGFGSYTMADISHVDPHRYILDVVLEHFNARVLSSSIWAKNDCGWSREAIADWLEAQGY